MIIKALILMNNFEFCFKRQLEWWRCIKSFSDINKKKNLFLFLLDLVTVIFFFVTQLQVTIFNVYFSFLRFKCCSLVFLWDSTSMFFKFWGSIRMQSSRPQVTEAICVCITPEKWCMVRLWPQPNSTYIISLLFVVI